MSTTIELLSKTCTKVSAALIDRHSKHCKACNDRRLMMAELYSMTISVGTRTDEFVARDLLLEETFEQCCKCFLGEE